MLSLLIFLTMLYGLLRSGGAVVSMEYGVVYDFAAEYGVVCIVDHNRCLVIYYCLAISVDYLNLCTLYEFRASSLLQCLGAGPCSSATGRETGAVELPFCIERNSRNSNQFVFHRLLKAER